MFSLNFHSTLKIISLLISDMHSHLVHDQIWWLLPVQNHSFTFCEPVTICGHSSYSAQRHSQRMIFALRAILACFPRIGANCEGLFVASHLCPFCLCVSYCRWQRGSAVCFAVRLQFFSFVLLFKRWRQQDQQAAQGYRGWSGDFQASLGHRKLCLKNREVQNSSILCDIQKAFWIGWDSKEAWKASLWVDSYL